MLMKALCPLVGLMVGMLCHQPAVAKLTAQVPVDQALSFNWQLNWDGKSELSAMGPALTYWIPVVSIVSLDGGSLPDDLDIRLQHRGLGPKEAEGIDHGTSELYHFKLNNVLTNLVAPPGATQNIPNSVQQVVHNGTGVKHRDDVRVEFRRVGSVIDFQVIARHVDSPVPEPATWGLSMAGLAALAVARRRSAR